MAKKKLHPDVRKKLHPGAKKTLHPGVRSIVLTPLVQLGHQALAPARTLSRIAASDKMSKHKAPIKPTFCALCPCLQACAAKNRLESRVWS